MGAEQIVPTDKSVNLVKGISQSSQMNDVLTHKQAKCP